MVQSFIADLTEMNESSEIDVLMGSSRQHNEYMAHMENLVGVIQQQASLYYSSHTYNESSFRRSFVHGEITLIGRKRGNLSIIVCESQ